MSTIHCSDDGLEPSRCWMLGSDTLSDELPATISRRLRQSTERVHQRLAWIDSSIAAAVLVGGVAVADIGALLAVWMDEPRPHRRAGQPTAGEPPRFSGTGSRQPFSWLRHSRARRSAPTPRATAGNRQVRPAAARSTPPRCSPAPASRARGARARRQEDVSLWKVDLQRAAGQPDQARRAVERADVVAQPEPVAVAEAQPGGVALVDEDVVAPGTVQRVDRGEDHRVELLAPAGGDRERPFGQVDGRRFEDREAGPSGRRRERPVGAEVPSTPLDRVTGRRQLLDARVGRDDVGDLGPQVPVGRPGEPLGDLGADPRREVGEDPPLAAGLTDLARGSRG